MRKLYHSPRIEVSVSLSLACSSSSPTKLINPDVLLISHLLRQHISAFAPQDACRGCLIDLRANTDTAEGLPICILRVDNKRTLPNFPEYMLHDPFRRTYGMGAEDPVLNDLRICIVPGRCVVNSFRDVLEISECVISHIHHLTETVCPSAVWRAAPDTD